MASILYNPKTTGIMEIEKRLPHTSISSGFFRNAKLKSIDKKALGHDDFV